MTKQKITIKEALELVEFEKCEDGGWFVAAVRGSCHVVQGNAFVVRGDCDFVEGEVLGTINGRAWQYIETPREKLQRLIKKTGNQELIEAFNQLEDN